MDFVSQLGSGGGHLGRLPVGDGPCGHGHVGRGSAGEAAWSTEDLVGRPQTALKGLRQAPDPLNRRLENGVPLNT